MVAATLLSSRGSTATGPRTNDPWLVPLIVSAWDFSSLLSSLSPLSPSPSLFPGLSAKLRSPILTAVSTTVPTPSRFSRSINGVFGDSASACLSVIFDGYAPTFSPQYLSAGHRGAPPWPMSETSIRDGTSITVSIPMPFSSPAAAANTLKMEPAPLPTGCDASGRTDCELLASSP